jgi:anaerobic magnesium-protoporphyrin IX monomethyl ester cyclase
VGRKSDLSRIFQAVRRLKAETKIELHLDLVAGLPGEGYDRFLTSLQVLAFLDPHEIQIEPLKLLKGTPMRELAGREDYHFSSFPPYTILRNPWLSFNDICRIETIGRLLELFQKHGGFSTAFRVLLQDLPFAAILDRMASVAAGEALSGLSCRRVHELFARLAAPLSDGDVEADLHDALFFDYCRSEMPLMGKLPSFAAARRNQCSWPGLGDLPAELNLPEGSRVKIFRYKFMRDYRTEPWENGTTIITFVYVSGAGRGLKVMYER